MKLTKCVTLIVILIGCFSVFGQTKSKKPTKVCDTKERLTLTDEGYQRVNPDDPNDLRLKPNPGLIESKPSFLRPAAGYCWANSDGFRVQSVTETTASSNSSTKLEIASYVANAQESGVTSGGIETGVFRADVKIKIKSIDEEGGVKAEVEIARRKGILSGKLDSAGKLLLEGTLVYNKRDLYETKLKATVKGNTLINGKYSTNTDAMAITGEFKVAVIVEDEE